MILISSKQVGRAFFSAPITHLSSFSILQALFEAATVLVVPLGEMSNTIRLIVAELALVLHVSRVVFIAAFAVLAVILPFPNITLKQRCVCSFSVLFAVLQVAYVLRSIRINDLCLTNHLIVVKLGIDDPSILEEQRSWSILPPVFIVALEGEESIVECVGALAVAQLADGV